MKYNRIQIDKNEIITEQAYQSVHRNLSGKFSINMVHSGSVDYAIAGRNLTLYPETFIFLNDTTCYSKTIDAAVQVDSMSLLFDPEFVNDFDYVNRTGDAMLLDNPVRSIHEKPLFVDGIYPLQGNLRFTLGHLKRHLDKGTDDSLLLAEYMRHCLINCQDVYQAEIVGRQAALNFLSHNTKAEILKRLSIAKDFIISNYNKNINLEDIAKTACLSVNHFLRTFKQAYHQSPHQFLTMIRLQQAKHFLRNTDYPINEIVDIIGFECTSSFIRLFRSSFNVTPGQYR